MAKVVINTCYGGFGLSNKAVLRYAELKGFALYVHEDTLCTHFYKIPVEEFKALEEECRPKREYHKINDLYFSDREIARDDPTLVQVIQELGEDANGRFSELKIVNIPKGVQWNIEEYDGREWVAEVHRTWD